MKMTIVVEEGKVVAAQQGHSGDLGRGAGLEAGPGQSINEIEVPDETISVSDPAKFEAEIGEYLKE